jgi:hypothetical protein
VRTFLDSVEHLKQLGKSLAMLFRHFPLSPARKYHYALFASPIE